jgi:protein-S-isoprenylcysteine O-methyltransferase Ste14
MSSSQLSRDGLIRMVFSRLILLIPGLFALFFLPAGTFAYWEAWLYLAILLIPMLFVLLYLLKNDPGLLERRMRLRERETEQKRIVKTYIFFLILAFLLPGFDHRFGWSNAPVAAVVAADILVLLGYGTFFLVLRENSYASRIVEVEQEQKVISSGPYALVRHPMYLGISVLYFFSPLALGSWWAMIPALMIFPILVGRIRNEETVLARDLQGYQEYMHKTRYRLIPGIW